eukprot:GEMP01014011.1.p1 GENE.GEMP01014011.1~~GEMP01014011.1.p1  ORF type:complete len:310 (+),score=26.50 GEMP01014011.1:183-1112(+)
MASYEPMEEPLVISSPSRMEPGLLKPLDELVELQLIRAFVNAAFFCYMMQPVEMFGLSRALQYIRTPETLRWCCAWVIFNLVSYAVLPPFRVQHDGFSMVWAEMWRAAIVGPIYIAYMLYCYKKAHLPFLQFLDIFTDVIGDAFIICPAVAGSMLLGYMVVDGFFIFPHIQDMPIVYPIHFTCIYSLFVSMQVVNNRFIRRAARGVFSPDAMQDAKIELLKEAQSNKSTYDAVRISEMNPALKKQCSSQLIPSQSSPMNDNRKTISTRFTRFDSAPITESDLSEEQSHESRSRSSSNVLNAPHQKGCSA